MLKITAQELADAAGVGVATVRRAEADEGGSPTKVVNQAIRRALEAAGVEFIPENGGGAGVRLRMQRSPYDYYPFPIFDVDLPFGPGRFGVYRDDRSYDTWTSLTLLQLGNPRHNFEDPFEIPGFWINVLNTGDILASVLNTALSKISGPRKPKHPSELVWFLYQPEHVYPGAREFAARLEIDWDVLPPRIIPRRTSDSLGGMHSVLLMGPRQHLAGLDWWHLDEVEG